MPQGKVRLRPSSNLMYLGSAGEAERSRVTLESVIDSRSRLEAGSSTVRKVVKMITKDLVIADVGDRSEVPWRALDAVLHVALILGLAVITISIQAQAPSNSQSKPQFEVASVKPCASKSPGT